MKEETIKSYTEDTPDETLIQTDKKQNSDQEVFEKEKNLEFGKIEKKLKFDELKEVAVIASKYIAEHAKSLGILTADFSPEKIDWMAYSKVLAGRYKDESKTIEVKHKANLYIIIHEIIHYVTSIKNMPNNKLITPENRLLKLGFHSGYGPKIKDEAERDILRGFNEAVTDKIAKEIFQEKKYFLVSDINEKYPETAEKLRKFSEDKKNFGLESLKYLEEAGEEAYRLNEKNLYFMGSFEEFIEEEKAMILKNFQENFDYIPGQSYAAEDKGTGYEKEIKMLDVILDKLANNRSKDKSININDARLTEWKNLQKAFFEGNTLYLRRIEKIIGSGTLRKLNKINRKTTDPNKLEEIINELIEGMQNNDE